MAVEIFEVETSRIVDDTYPADVSYLTQDYPDASPADRAEYMAQDAERLARFNAGDWHFVGVRARATIAIPAETEHRWIACDRCNSTGWTPMFRCTECAGEGFKPVPRRILQTIESPGLWGIESDSDDSYFAEVAGEELAQLGAMLRELGADPAEVDAAIEDAAGVPAEQV